MRSPELVSPFLSRQLLNNLSSNVQQPGAVWNKDERDETSGGQGAGQNQRGTRSGAEERGGRTWTAMDEGGWQRGRAAQGDAGCTIAQQEGGLVRALSYSFCEVNYGYVSL